MRGGRIRGWRGFEWPFRGIAGDAVDPVWSTSFLKGRSHITLRRNWFTDSSTERSQGSRLSGG